jgi:hypothetical protein
MGEGLPPPLTYLGLNKELTAPESAVRSLAMRAGGS